MSRTDVASSVCPVHRCGSDRSCDRNTWTAGRSGSEHAGLPGRRLSACRADRRGQPKEREESAGWRNHVHTPEWGYGVPDLRNDRWRHDVVAVRVRRAGGVGGRRPVRRVHAAGHGHLLGADVAEGREGSGSGVSPRLALGGRREELGQDDEPRLLLRPRADDRGPDDRQVRRAASTSASLYGYPVYTVGVFRSEDDGRTWTGPVEAANGGGTIGINDIQPMVLSDGTLVVPYADFDFLPGKAKMTGKSSSTAWTVLSEDGGVSFGKAPQDPDDAAQP